MQHVDFEGLQILSVHAALNEPSTLKHLLRNSLTETCVNDRDADGDRTPVHWAAARGALRCARLLLDAGADLAALDAEGRTPLALAIAHNQHAMRELLEEQGSPERGARTAALLPALVPEAVQLV